MAGPQVTLTFAGDSAALERTFDKVGSGSRSLEGDLDRLGRATDDARDRASRYGSGLDGLGNRADELDTRMMGLSDGIQGTTDLMRSGTLAPHELAMAFADLGSAAYNTVVPSLQDVRTKVGDTITTLREGGPAADDMRRKLSGFATLGAGIAGIVGVATAIHQVNEAVSEAKIEQLTTQFLATGDAAQTLADIGNEHPLNPFKSGADELIGTFEELLRQSPEVAESFVDQMEAADGVSSATEFMREAIDTARAANEGATEAQEANTRALRDYSDALAAAFDPMFGLIDAQNANAEAQRAVTEAQAALNEATATYGAASPEAAAAARELSDAQLANAESALGVTTATHTLTEAIRNGDVSISQLREQMSTWDSQGLLTQGVLQAVADRMGITMEQARALGDTDPTIDVEAIDYATSPIMSIAENLGWLDGQRATTYIDTVRTEFIQTIREGLGWGAATGGIVPQYLATGGSVIGGPRGTDTVPAWLSPGEMVLNAGQQAELFAMANGRGGGGGPVYNVTVQGSVLGDRDLARKLQELNERGGRR